MCIYIQNVSEKVVIRLATMSHTFVEVFVNRKTHSVFYNFSLKTIIFENCLTEYMVGGDQLFFLRGLEGKIKFNFFVSKNRSQPHLAVKFLLLDVGGLVVFGFMMTQRNTTACWFTTCASSASYSATELQCGLSF